MDEAPAARRPWAAASIVFAIALAARLVFLWTSSDRAWPHSIYYEGDAPEWVNYAAALDRGREYEFDLPIRSPAVAYLLHWLDPGIVEGPFTGFKIIWCVLSAAACALAYITFRREFDQLTSVIAAGLCCFSFGLYITATSLNNEALYLPVVCGIVLLTLELKARPSTWIAIALAVLHGVATLIRPEHTLLLLMVLGYAAWHWRLGPRPTNPTAIRAAALLSIVLLGSSAICLPWSLRGSLAAQRLNEMDRAPFQWTDSPIPWSDDARAFIESLPAFARGDNFRFISASAHSKGERQVTGELAQRTLLEEFGSIPEPLRTWTFVSSQGPLSFALANHPQARGGFSKVGLLHPRFGADPRLNLSMPSHLELYNDGYAVGWRWIRADIATWLGNVARKLANFSDGIALGFTSRNMPLGAGGVRRPIDVVAPAPETALGRAGVIAWKICMLGLLAIGIVKALQRRVGAIWLLVIAYKLIVTIAFYGYARQAVSILPAFYIFMALPMAPLIRQVRARAWMKPESVRAIAIVMFGLLIFTDWVLASTRPTLRPEGPVRTADKWGPAAFESYETIRLRPRTWE